jgi:hypothetical protein
MRTTLSINDHLLKEAKKRSIQRNCTLGEVVDEALRLSLTAPKRTGTANQTTRPLKTFTGSGVQSGIELNNSASLLEAMDA